MGAVRDMALLESALGLERRVSGGAPRGRGGAGLGPEGLSDVPAGTVPRPAPHISSRCADCHQHIAADGSGHRSWCPFAGRTDCPRLNFPFPRPVLTPGRVLSSDGRGVVR